MPGRSLIGQCGHIGQFEGHVAGETRVDEAGGGVGQQAEAAEAGLALDAGGEFVSEAHDLEGRGEHELAGMQDERLAVGDLHQRGEVVLLDRRVDVRVQVVVEDAEPAVQPYVDAGGLDQLAVERLEVELATLVRGHQVPVG